MAEVVNIIGGYSEGKNDAVISVYMCPDMAIINTSTDLKYSGQTSPAYDSVELSRPSSLNGYIPKNNKLLTFPFCYVNLSNNNGTTNTYQYELFNEIDESPNKIIFNIKGVPVIGASIKCSPFNYKSNNEDNNEEEGIMAGKFPTLSWSADEYINWLTQQSVNIGVGLASNLVSIVGGVGLIASGGGATAGASSIVSGGLGIANQLGQIYQHSLTPNSARGNINGGDINVSSKNNGFYFYKMSIKKEYAQIIDDFFSLYGYKVNSMKIPNLKGRQNWNYVKTLNCNIIGDIPQNDLQLIKNIFNDGVTLWHNPLTFLDYSQSNNIIGVN